MLVYQRVAPNKQGVWVSWQDTEKPSPPKDLVAIHNICEKNLHEKACISSLFQSTLAAKPAKQVPFLAHFAAPNHSSSCFMMACFSFICNSHGSWPESPHPTGPSPVSSAPLENPPFSSMIFATSSTIDRWFSQQNPPLIDVFSH